MRGLITAIVTPMTDKAEVDYASLTNLINYQITNGAVGLVVLGSTGEAAMLNSQEKLSIVKHSIDVIAKRVKVIIGITPVTTNDAILWLDELNKISGIDYVLAVTPAYVKAPQRGLIEHFSLLADKAKMPVILYNVPGRTASDLHDDTTLQLAKHQNIAGLKDATGDISRCCYLVKQRHEGFCLYSGDDVTSMAFSLCGGDGAISVTGNVAPKIMQTMLNYAITGNKTLAIKTNNQLLELHSMLFIESNPIPVKWALYDLKIINSPTLRLPLTTLSHDHAQKLQASLINVQSA